MSLSKDADNRLMSLALFIFTLSFSVYAGPYIRYRAYEYERVNMTKTHQTSDQNRFAPRRREFGFRLGRR